MALTCRVLLNSRSPFLMINKCRITLIPPAVEPAEPPKKNKPKKKMVKKGVQLVKSAETNPVVVITVTTAKRACLKAASA